jgi:ubiquinone/menaquinone biosynthesis C-methylase UbiE
MKLLPTELASAMEAKLREHPGVLQAMVLVWRRLEPEHRIVAYVVPDDEYIDRTLAGANDESRRIQKWRKTYELTQLGKASPVARPDFNILGWNSTYTRRPIPDEQMREWIECTVQEILRCEPSEVLEIGCGVGLLLLRLARRCERYVGVDNAPVILKTLKEQMQQLGGGWTQVELLERAADNFAGLAENSFDTVIVNSVAQYFPSLDYLLNILQQSVRVVRPGGRMFLGDLRSLPLQWPFATSVELFQAPPAMSIGELRERVSKRIRLDEQLVLSPALFLALRHRWPRISRVELRPRHGRFDNEMTRYRFDAILHIGDAPAKSINPRWISWPLEGPTLESLATTLSKQNPETLAFTEVPNRRIQQDILAFAELQTRSAAEPVASLQNEIHRAENQGIDPQDLWSLGSKLKYDIQISWAAARTDGSYDVVFKRSNPHESTDSAAVAWPEPPTGDSDLALCANAPIKAIPREKLLQQLRGYCQQHFPDAIRPNDIILLNKLTLTPDGQPDPQALPSPDGVHS